MYCPSRGGRPFSFALGKEGGFLPSSMPSMVICCTISDLEPPRLMPLAPGLEGRKPTETSVKYFPTACCASMIWPSYPLTSMDWYTLWMFSLRGSKAITWHPRSAPIKENTPRLDPMSSM